MLYENLLPPQWGRHLPTLRKGIRRKEQRSEKIEKKKGSRYRGRNPTSIPVNDALIGEEEQTGKKEREQRNRKQVSNSTTLDPSVASYDPQGSYGEPIFVIPPTQRGIYILFMHNTLFNLHFRPNFAFDYIYI